MEQPNSHGRIRINVVINWSSEEAYKNYLNGKRVMAQLRLHGTTNPLPAAIDCNNNSTSISPIGKLANDRWWVNQLLRAYNAYAQNTSICGDPPFAHVLLNGCEIGIVDYQFSPVSDTITTQSTKHTK